MPYLDLSHKLRHDTAFRESLLRLTRRLEVAEKSKDRSVDRRAVMAEVIQEVYRLCGYNSGVLLPWYFPKAINGGPLSLTRRTFAYPFYDLNIGGSLTIRGSRQIAKSHNLACRQLLNMLLIAGWRSLYVVPHPKQLQTYAYKLDDVQKGFRFYRPDARLRQNLYSKGAANGSTVKLEHCLTSAQAIRGSTADEVAYDEYQHFDDAFEEEIEQVQKSSETPTSIYTGTATNLNSPLENKFQQSSMATWVVKVGNNWLDFGDKELVMKMFKPQGLRDPDTGRPINVVDGHWAHHNKKQEEAGILGFHVPQVIVPDYGMSLVGYADLYKSFLDDDPAKFSQEILGIPVTEGDRELSEADLKAICLLGTRQEAQARALAGQYKHVVSGCDWGGSDWQPAHKTKISYTVHIMMGVRNTGQCEIIHMRQYSGMNYEEIGANIVADHNRLKGTAMASDFGVGMAYNEFMRRALNPLRHLIFGYSAPNSAIIGKPANGMVNQYSLNKSEAVSATIMAIKRVKEGPRIRCFDWTESSRLLLDCMNSYRVVSEQPAGGSSFRFIRDPKAADDTFHAITFAYALARILLGEPLFEDQGLRRHISQQLGIAAGGVGGQSMGGGHWSG